MSLTKSELERAVWFYEQRKADYVRNIEQYSKLCSDLLAQNLAKNPVLVNQFKANSDIVVNLTTSLASEDLDTKIHNAKCQLAEAFPEVIVSKKTTVSIGPTMSAGSVEHYYNTLEAQPTEK